MLGGHTASCEPSQRDFPRHSAAFGSLFDLKSSNSFHLALPIAAPTP